LQADRLAETEPTEKMKAHQAELRKLRDLVLTKGAPRTKLTEAEKADDILAVSKALDVLLKDAKQPTARLAAVRACQRWGTKENGPELNALSRQVPALKDEIDKALQAIDRR
jgi:hypothetical protein